MFLVEARERFTAPGSLLLTVLWLASSGSGRLKLDEVVDRGSRVPVPAAGQAGQPAAAADWPLG